MDNDAFDQGKQYSPKVSCLNSLPSDYCRSSAPSSEPSYVLMYPQVRVITNHPPCSSSLAWAPTHSHLLLQSNLEQLPRLPQECALSMTISQILHLNDPKVSTFTNSRLALSSMPRQSIGQKWAHSLELLLHKNVCSKSTELFTFHLLQYLLCL